MKCQILFSVINKKKKINLSSADLALRVVKVKYDSIYPCLANVQGTYVAIC